MSLKKKIANFVGGTFIPNLFKFTSKGAKIVFYHGVVSEPISDKMIQANQMSFEDFKKHIEFYEKEYSIVSIDVFSDRFERKQLKGDELVITFDDGYKNNLDIVAPYLKSKNIPFTVFICPELSSKGLRVPTYYVRLAIYGTDRTTLEIKSLDRSFSISTLQEKNETHNELIEIVKTSNRSLVVQILDDILTEFSKEELGKYNELYSSEKLLTIEEIKDLANNYPCTIGSHCLDHTILHKNQDKIEISRQIVESKKKIKEIIEGCDYFAFPNGDLKSVCVEAISEASHSYRYGFAVNGKKVSFFDDKGYISRIGVAPDFNVFRIQMLILSGLK